jgi:hypothetical protein
VGTLWGGDGGKKVPPRRGGAGTGDGAGIMGRGRGMGSPPQTRPIAIPNPDGLKTMSFIMKLNHYEGLA